MTRKDYEPRGRRPTKKTRGNHPGGKRPGHSDSRLLGITKRLLINQEMGMIPARQGPVVRSPAMAEMLQDQASLLEGQLRIKKRTS